MHLDLKSEQCPPPFTCNDIANVVNPFIRREIFAKSRYRPRSKVRKAKERGDRNQSPPSHLQSPHTIYYRWSLGVSSEIKATTCEYCFSANGICICNTLTYMVKKSIRRLDTKLGTK